MDLNPDPKHFIDSTVFYKAIQITFYRTKQNRDEAYILKGKQGSDFSFW